MARGRAPAGARSAVVERLVAAVTEPGCPICRCLEIEARRDLAAYLREQTMDPAGRAALRRAGGFCAWHTSLLPEAADGILSVALLVEDLLAAPAPPRAACPACAALRTRLDEYLRALLEPAATARLGRGLGLPCRPHLRALRARARRDPRLGALEAALGARAARLRADVAGFIAKQDYRSAEAPTAEEARAWSEGLAHLGGRLALFGSDLARD
ncbi:MAG TPA: hypothetical protein VGX21_17240 [Methylomirabilota bacterium]|jgi:hypothetical protein|nr:hypothetical protein [Methylomirabilota bacterium]